MNKMNKKIKLVPLLMCVCLLGCGSYPQVQAWEKGNLARAEMRFSQDRLGEKFNEQIYASKEASSGGVGVGGGGCGCN